MNDKYLLLDSNTFNEMLSEFAKFINRVDVLCEKHGKKETIEWLDSQDVCQILNIKPRTLQSYRDSGKLGFSQIEGKIFYRNEDVQKLLDKNKFNVSTNKKGTV